MIGFYEADNTSVDHNLYVRGNKIFASNYLSGLRVSEIGPNGNLTPYAYFDTNPDTDSVAFYGTWSNYLFPERQHRHFMPLCGPLHGQRPDVRPNQRRPRSPSRCDVERVSQPRPVGHDFGGMPRARLCARGECLQAKKSWRVALCLG